MSYRWSNSYEWLQEKSERWSKARLRLELLRLARIVDDDVFQVEYREEMDKDGYFTEGR